MTTDIRRLAGTVAATTAMAAASLAAAAPASAQENLRGSVSFPAAPVVECDGAMQIGLGFDVDLTFHWTYEGDALVRERLTMRYTGQFANLSTGEVSTPVRGTSNTVIDLTEGTLTASGNPRSMTMPGVGVVLHEAGRFVLDLETGQVLVERGPKLNETTPEGARLVCEAMGLTGGTPLEPPDVHD